MIQLEKDNYKKIKSLIKTQNELSVNSVIEGIIPGEIYVNDINNPTAALIQTSECNLITGRIDDQDFNRSVKEELDFWDPIIPDTEEWSPIIPSIHSNRFIRKYLRRHYILRAEDQCKRISALPEGFQLESVSPSLLREKQYQNTENLLEWIGNWGDDKTFMQYGVGSYVRKDDTIVSWSLSDCSYQDKIAIGIHTDARYRNKGLGILAASETIKMCRERGYSQIEWLCVDGNKGSIALAEKLGFTLISKYTAFSSYPPYENPRDLSDAEWLEWAQYFENAAKSEPRLWLECFYAFIKANEPDKAYEILKICSKRGDNQHNVDGFISYLHSIGMASKFSNSWRKNILL